MMNHPPETLDGAKVIKYCILDDRVLATGNHRITIDDKSFIPSAVAICQYVEDKKFYIFYCDENWEVITDSDENSLEEAIGSLEHSYKNAPINLQTPNF